MPNYRIQILTFGNKIAGPAVEVDCQSDEEAVAKARTLLTGQDIEIWSGTRFVTRLRFAARLAGPILSAGSGRPPLPAADDRRDERRLLRDEPRRPSLRRRPCREVGAVRNANYIAPS